MELAVGSGRGGVAGVADDLEAEGGRTEPCWMKSSVTNRRRVSHSRSLRMAFIVVSISNAFLLATS